MSQLVDFDARLAEPLIGIDEVGRGCLLGPVFAAAVHIPDITPVFLRGVKDSKQLSPLQRANLRDSLSKTSIYAIGISSVSEIDTYGIVPATLLAMRRALDIVLAQLGTNAYLVLIDGRDRLPDLPTPQRNIIRGDQQSLHIAAASILAKQARDQYITDVLHAEHPCYDLNHNKGYGTPKHIDALKKLGACPEHRRLFIRKYGH